MSLFHPLSPLPSYPPPPLIQQTVERSQLEKPEHQKRIFRISNKIKLYIFNGANVGLIRNFDAALAGFQSRSIWLTGAVTSARLRL